MEILTESLNKKIGLFTDIHLGVEKDSSDRLDESIKCYEWIIETFLKNNVKWIIFLGDLFESRTAINSKTLNVGIDLISKLSNKFEKVFIITGNHDCYYKNTNEVNSVEFFKKLTNNNVYVISNSPFYIDLCGTMLGLFPWASEQLIIENKISQTCDYGFGHFEANGFLQPSGISSGCKTNFKDLFKFANYIFSGHYHINKLYTNSSDLNNKLQMIGSPLQLNWSDYNLKKYIYTLDVCDNKITAFENTVNSIYQKIYYSKLNTNIYTKEELINLCKNNFVKLVVDIKYEFNLVLTYLNDLKTYNPKTIEVEYLISLTTDLANKTTEELEKSIDKNNLDYIIDYINKIYPDIEKIDKDINKDTLINMIKNYYENVENN